LGCGRAPVELGETEVEKPKRPDRGHFPKRKTGFSKPLPLTQQQGKFGDTRLDFLVLAPNPIRTLLSAGARALQPDPHDRIGVAVGNYLDLLVRDAQVE
jgi:hypothetical protein